jgi:hypothetical protein
MIGQKDNRLNIETAAASHQIAELSLRHNSAMKDMAEDSRHIAMLTRKDSTDMRIIAVVTLLFLPGTFIATFFSADFFNFFPDAQQQVVSKWVWLYLVLTIALTGLVFIGWFLTSRKENKSVLTVLTERRPSIISSNDAAPEGNARMSPTASVTTGLSEDHSDLKKMSTTTSKPEISQSLSSLSG